MSQVQSQSHEQLELSEQATINKKSGEQTVIITPIRETPFTYVENKETNKNFISLGNIIVLNNVDTFDLAKDIIPDIDWNLFANILFAYFKYYSQNQK